jgi:hypothetical protein
MPERLVIPQIVGAPIKLQITALDDADETTILTVVHSADKPEWAESFAHTRAGALRSLGRDAELGKADSSGGRRYRDGTFRQYVSEADQVPNAPGSSVDICYYDTPATFPPQSAPPGGASAAQLAQHEDRLDWAAYQAGVAANALALASEALASAAAAFLLMAQKTRG